MAETPRTVVSRNVGADIPLPGNYPCLTLQLNVTVYQGADTIRWTLTVREPTEQWEVTRRVVDTEQFGPHTVDALLLGLREAVTEARWLQQGNAY